MNWQMVKKRDEHKVAADGRNIFLRKKIIQHQVQYHEKGDFYEKDNYKT